MGDCGAEKQDVKTDGGFTPSSFLGLDGVWVAFSKTAIDDTFTLSYSHRPKFRAVSSAVEHYTDT